MNAKSLVTGFLTGAAVGVTAGLLLAPASGKKTQKKIARSARKFGEDMRDRAEESLESLKTKFNDSVDHLGNKGKEKLDKIKV